MLKFPDMLEVYGFPITLCFEKSGTAYLSERLTGIVWKIEEDKYTKVKELPILKAIGHHEVGLLGIALDPDFETNRYLYAYYTEGETLENCTNKVVKINTKTKETTAILEGIPGGEIHNGGIIAFGPDKKLYVTTGVGNEIKEKSQDIKYLGGKVLRIGSDGSIPKDNPFANSPVFSYGHRNVFGIAFHPGTGKPFASEAGPEKDDEINIIKRGGNYGWPSVTGKAETKEYIDPIITYTPTITPTQCCFVGNDFYFGSYNEGTVHKLTLRNAEVIADEVIYRGRPFGVIGVFTSPDGRMFVATQNKIMSIS